MKEPFPNIDLAVSLLRAAAPWDFPPILPIYCVGITDLPASFESGGGWLAYVRRGLADQLRPHLSYAGKWKGDGFAFVFNDRRAITFDDGLAWLIHEAGHYVDFAVRDFVNSSTDAFSAISRKGASFRRYWNRPGIDPDHGGPWIRAAIHLRERICQRHTVELWKMTGANYPNNIPPADSLRLCLARELRESARMPIQAILLSDPPKPFLQLWDE